jgi:ATP-dependent DNA ligase
VSKVRDSVYPTGRSNDWVKKTCAQRETLTIAGFALDGSKWDGLYVGRRKGDDLVYAGKVDHGRAEKDHRRHGHPIQRFRWTSGSFCRSRPFKYREDRRRL